MLLPQATSMTVAKAFPVPKMASLLSSESSEVSNTMAHLLQRIFLSFVFSGEESDKESEISGSQVSVIASILQMLLTLIVSYDIKAANRDGILELFMDQLAVKDCVKCLCNGNSLRF